MSCVIQDPEQGIRLVSLRWEPRALTTGPPGEVLKYKQLV